MACARPRGTMPHRARPLPGFPLPACSTHARPLPARARGGGGGGTSTALTLPTHPLSPPHHRPLRRPLACHPGPALAGGGGRPHAHRDGRHPGDRGPACLCAAVPPVCRVRQGEREQRGGAKTRSVFFFVPQPSPRRRAWAHPRYPCLPSLSPVGQTLCEERGVPAHVRPAGPGVWAGARRGGPCIRARALTVHLS